MNTSEEDKTPEESKIDEKTVKKLLNKISQNISEKNYEQALEFVNEALSSQKTLVQIAKNLEMNLSKNKKNSSDEENQKTLFEF